MIIPQKNDVNKKADQNCKEGNKSIPPSIILFTSSTIFISFNSSSSGIVDNLILGFITKGMKVNTPQIKKKKG